MLQAYLRGAQRLLISTFDRIERAAQPVPLDELASSSTLLSLFCL